MHEYTVLDSKKKTAIFIMAVLSISLSKWIANLLTFFGLTAWTITSSLVFGGFYWLFNRFIWKNKWIKKALGMPDLNGEWTCKALSNNIGNGKQYDWEAKIKITQTLDKICISMINKQSSTSNSITACIKNVEGTDYQLSYNYENKPTVTAAGDMRKHDGFCVLTFKENDRTAEGYYFNNIQDRKTYGEMQLQKEAK